MYNDHFVDYCFAQLEAEAEYYTEIAVAETEYADSIEYAAHCFDFAFYNIDQAYQDYCNTIDAEYELALTVIYLGGDIGDCYFSPFEIPSATPPVAQMFSAAKISDDASVWETCKGYGVNLASTLWHDYRSNVGKFVYGVTVTGPQRLYWGTGELIYDGGVVVSNIVEDPKREFNRGIDTVKSKAEDAIIFATEAARSLKDDPLGTLQAGGEQALQATVDAGNFVLDNPEEAGAMYFNGAVTVVSGKATANVLGKFATSTKIDVDVPEGTNIQSGAFTGRIPIDDWDAAEKAYDSIRNSTDDVLKIAENTGFRPENIQKIKDHIFNDSVLKDRGLDSGEIAEFGRFDADPRIANAWARLTNGTHSEEDIVLLKHEIAERKYMIIWDDRSYDRAHRKALDKYFPTFSNENE